MVEEIGNLLKKVAKSTKSSYKKGFCKSQFVRNPFLVRKKDGGKQDYHQFEESKSVHHSPPFQNGEPAIIERYPQIGQLHVQIGSKGCIFLHLTSGGVEEICEILLAGGIYNHVQKIWEKLCKLRKSRNHRRNIVEQLQYNCLQQLPTLRLKT